MILNMAESTIIAHGLKRFENINPALHEVTNAILEPSSPGKSELFGGYTIYSCDIAAVIKDGDGRFQDAYKGFRKHVKQALVSVPTRGLLHSQVR